MSDGQQWNGLKRAWTGYKIANATQDIAQKASYASAINEFQQNLNLPQTDFAGYGGYYQPNIYPYPVQYSPGYGYYYANTYRNNPGYLVPQMHAFPPALPQTLGRSENRPGDVFHKKPDITNFTPPNQMPDPAAFMKQVEEKDKRQAGTMEFFISKFGMGILDAAFFAALLGSGDPGDKTWENNVLALAKNWPCFRDRRWLSKYPWYHGPPPGCEAAWAEAARVWSPEQKIRLKNLTGMDLDHQTHPGFVERLPWWAWGLTGVGVWWWWRRRKPSS